MALIFISGVEKAMPKMVFELNSLSQTIIEGLVGSMTIL
jgi:hypothetical protein